MEIKRYNSSVSAEFNLATSHAKKDATPVEVKFAIVDWLKKHKIAKCQPYALNYPA